MSNKYLKYYAECFKSLRRDSNKKKGAAPHKPILLLSIIDLYNGGYISSPKVFITPEIVGRFKTNWSNYVSTSHDKNFALPYSHMSGEPFWKLIPNPGCEKWVQAKSSLRSFRNLKIAVSHAQIDVELHKILLDSSSRAILKKVILDTYFPTTSEYSPDNDSDMISDIKQQIFNDKEAEYSKRIISQQHFLDKNSYEEEIFVRSEIFKRELPRLYNYTCAISNLRIDATENISMIDACHIIPFGISHNDTIQNGISLCPNLHRAFDRGIISIDDNYRVLISSKFVESGSSTYSIKQYQGQRILLPSKEEYYPSKINLANHRERFGFNI